MKIKDILNVNINNLNHHLIVKKFEYILLEMISDQVNTNDHTYKKKTHLINAVTNTQHSSNTVTQYRTIQKSQRKNKSKFQGRIKTIQHKHAT